MDVFTIKESCAQTHVNVNRKSVVINAIIMARPFFCIIIILFNLFELLLTIYQSQYSHKFEEHRYAEVYYYAAPQMMRAVGENAEHIATYHRRA